MVSRHVDTWIAPRTIKFYIVLIRSTINLIFGQLATNYLKSKLYMNKFDVVRTKCVQARMLLPWGDMLLY